MLLKNSGNYDQDTETKANINIKFVITDIDKYNMTIKNSYDLMIEHKINIYDALTGYSMYFDNHPNGNKYNFKFNDVIEDGDIKFIKNLGLPYNDGKTQKNGKLYITFKYIYPNTILDNENYKTFIKTRNNAVPNDKDFIKEKVYDIKDDKTRTNNNNEQNDHQQVNGCQQS